MLLAEGESLAAPGTKAERKYREISGSADRETQIVKESPISLEGHVQEAVERAYLYIRLVVVVVSKISQAIVGRAKARLHAAFLYGLSQIRDYMDETGD